MVLVSAMHITAGVYVNDNESGLSKISISGSSIWRLSAKTTSIMRQAKTMATLT